MLQCVEHILKDVQKNKACLRGASDEGRTVQFKLQVALCLCS